MISLIQRHRKIALALAGCIVIVVVMILARPSTPPTQTPASNPSADNVIATAPGWVDTETGVQRLGVRSDGSVDTVAVHEGDIVNKDSVLLSLDTRQTDLELQAAKLELQQRRSEITTQAAQLSRAQEEIARLKPLVAAEAESADELRTARAHAEDLRAQKQQTELSAESLTLQIALIENRVQRQHILAPEHGEILRVLAHPGDAVTAGTPLLWFVASGPRIVRAEIDERLFGQVNPGMRAEIAPEYDDTRIYSGRVLRVARVVGPVQSLPELRPGNKDDRVVECVLSIDSNELLIGQRVLVRIAGGH